MPKSLVITEKPSVARDLSNALRGEFVKYEDFYESSDMVITWAVGHLLELEQPEDIDPKYRVWKLEDLPIIPPTFRLRPKEKTSKLVSNIKKLVRRDDVDTVVNACDAGREGELIFREICSFLDVKKPTRRLWLQSMTPAAIRDGFARLRDGHEYDNLGASAQCRSEADWLIGMNATRALTRRMKQRNEASAWSAGRVQTPTLALLVDRELEVLAHRPTPFWRIKASFVAPDHRYEATWFDPSFKASADSPRKEDWITEEATLQAILAAVRGQAGTATEVRKVSTEAAPPLYDLTSLQRDAANLFGMSSKRTLNAAQKLYEGLKLITYPRTDSTCLPSDYRPHVQQVIDLLQQSGHPIYARVAADLKRQGLKNEARTFNDQGVSDHFAIIPTNERPSFSLDGDAARVYNLVVARFLATFMGPASWYNVDRTTTVSGHSFRSRGRFLKEAGWREVLGKEGTEETRLPPLQASFAVAQRSDEVAVTNDEANAQEEETRPPARISEARLLSLMEAPHQQVDDADIKSVLKEKGLGTPATRADIIENLIIKEYAARTGKTLRATSKGILLIDLLRRIHVDRLASAQLTGELESHLREVEEGRRTRERFMQEVTEYTREIVEHTRTFEYDTLYRGEAALGTCPLCKARPVYERPRFYACEGNTGKGQGVCSFTLWKDRSGRYLDRLVVTELLERGETGKLDGFRPLRGDPYSGRLRLTAEGQLELIAERGEGDEAAPQETFEVCEDPLGPCPYDAACLVRETPTLYACAASCVTPGSKRKGGFVLPRSVCQRPITRDEAIIYLQTGRSPRIDNFVSKKGKNFKAYLIFKPENGRYTFEWVPRESKAGAARPAGSEAAGEPATARARAVRGSSRSARGAGAPQPTKADTKRAAKAGPSPSATRATKAAGKASPTRASKAAPAARKTARSSEEPTRRSSAAREGRESGSSRKGSGAPARTGAGVEPRPRKTSARAAVLDTSSMPPEES